MNSYRDLKVWQNNQSLVKLVARLLDTPSKKSDEIVLKQLFRSLTSIGANLAEGSEYYEGAEFQRYIKIALASAIESDYWLRTLLEINNDSVKELVPLNVETIKMLKGLLKSIQQKRNS